MAAAQAAKQKKVPTMPNRIQEFTKLLDEMIGQLNVMEASFMEEDVKRRRIHPLREKKPCMSSGREKEDEYPTSRRACDSATNFSSLQGAKLRLHTNTQQGQPDESLQTSASYQNSDTEDQSKSSNKNRERSGKDLNRCRTGLLKRNRELENLLVRCLSAFKQNSAFIKTPVDVQLMLEIQEELAPNPRILKRADEPKTKITPTPVGLLDVKLESWENMFERRLKERRKKSSTWGKYFLSKLAIDTKLNIFKPHSSLVQSINSGSDITNLDQSKPQNDDDGCESDDEIFVTPVSSLVSIDKVSSATSSESLPSVELMEPRPRIPSRGQQTQQRFDIDTRWAVIHGKWGKVVSMSSNWRDQNASFS